MKAKEPLISVLDAVDEKIYVSDPETYRILYANPAGMDDGHMKEILGSAKKSP